MCQARDLSYLLPTLTPKLICRNLRWCQYAHPSSFQYSGFSIPQPLLLLSPHYSLPAHTRGRIILISISNLPLSVPTACPIPFSTQTQNNPSTSWDLQLTFYCSFLPPPTHMSSLPFLPSLNSMLTHLILPLHVFSLSLPLPYFPVFFWLNQSSPPTLHLHFHSWTWQEKNTY